MQIFTESQYDELSAVADPAVRKYEAAKRMASIGIKIFPARAYDGKSFDKAYAEWEEDHRAAKEEGRKPKLAQKHYKQYGGKAPAFPDQYAKATNVLAQIERWWHPTTGKYRGNNVCVATGKESGLVVVDLDVKPEEGVDGFMWWTALTSEHGEVDTFRVRTGGQSSGGQHIYFKYRDGVPNANGFAPGVDIRSDDQHVVGPFSECQGAYTAIDFSDIAEMPDWLFDVLTRKDKDKRARDDSERPDFDVTPLDQIEEMLEFLDPNDPDIDQSWMQIMYAVNSEHPTEAGLEVIQRWSSQNMERYDEPQNADIWDRATQDKPRGVSINTLYHLAEDYGWVNPRRSSEDLDQIVAIRMMNRSFAVIDPDQCVLDMQRRGKKLDRSKMPPVFVPPMTMFKTRFILTPEGRQEHHYAKVADVTSAHIRMMTGRYQVPTFLPGGKMGKPRSLYDVWMNSPARTSYASAGFYINPKRCPPGVLNLFPGFKVQPKEGHPELFMKHVLEILCGGDHERARWVINRLAYLVQFGDQITPTALAVTGEQGSGKTIVADYMSEVLGELNYKYLHDSNGLDTRFSEEIVGKFIICADEAIFSGDPKLRNKLKSLVSANILRDEGKGKAVRDAQNVMFLMIFSNEDEPVSIERGDRRFTIMKTNNKYSKLSREKDPAVDKEARGYFKALVKEMKTDGPAKLLHMLMEWEVDHELARTAMETQEKQVMAEKRVMKCDSITAYIMHLYVTGYEPEDDETGNSIGEGWGGRTQMGPFHSSYQEWTTSQRHRNSEWKPEDVKTLRDRLIDNFGCSFIKPRNKSTIVWPSKDSIAESLRELVPELMKDLDKEDISGETEF